MPFTSLCWLSPRNQTLCKCTREPRTPPILSVVKCPTPNYLRVPMGSQSCRSRCLTLDIELVQPGSSLTPSRPISRIGASFTACLCEVALDCDSVSGDSASPPGCNVRCPMGLGGSWIVLRMVVGRGVSPPIFEHSIWQATALMPRSPTSTELVSHPLGRVLLAASMLTFAAMMSNWNFSQ